MARIEERAGRLVEHLAGKHNQKNHGRHHKGVIHRPEVAYDALVAGSKPNVHASAVGAVLDLAAEGDAHPDLTELHVDGTHNFGDDGLGYKRSEMPQLDARGPEYLAALQKRGIKVTTERVDPRTLQPTQKEVSAKSSGLLLRQMRDGSLPAKVESDPAWRSIVSNDNYVLDGHHRWGAGVAYAFEKPGFTTLITRVDMPMSKLLKDADAWTQEAGIAKKAIGEAVVEEHYPHNTGTPQSVHGGKGVPAGYKDRAGFGTKDADGPDVEGRLVMWPNGRRATLDTPDPELVATLARFSPDERRTMLDVAAKTKVPKSIDEVPWEHSEHFRISHADAIDELSAMATYKAVWKGVPGEMDKMLDAGGGVLAYVYPKQMLKRVADLDNSVWDNLAEATVEEAEDILIEHLAGKHDQKLHGRKGSGGGGTYEERLRETERSIMGIRGGETLVVLDKDGNEVYRKSAEGDPDGDGPAGAGMSTAEADPALFEGNTVTHNHPVHDWGEPATSMSSRDIASAAAYNVGEVRAVNPDGTVFSLKPGPEGWPPPNLLSFQLAISEMTIGSQVAEAVEAGKIAPSHSNSIYHLRLGKSVADTFGMTFEVTNVG